MWTGEMKKVNVKGKKKVVKSLEYEMKVKKKCEESMKKEMV